MAQAVDTSKWDAYLMQVVLSLEDLTVGAGLVLINRQRYECLHFIRADSDGAPFDGFRLAFLSGSWRVFREGMEPTPLPNKPDGSFSE
jgi:hypothetical protein